MCQMIVDVSPREYVKPGHVFSVQWKRRALFLQDGHYRIVMLVRLKPRADRQAGLAVSTAKQIAVGTGKPVTVVVHIASGGSRKTIFNPDGTNEKIWTIDKGQSLVPTVGQVYANRGGGKYLCLARVTEHGSVYYNPAGYSSDTAGVFQNVKIGWTFTAKGIIQHIDGTIEWNHSTDGRFEDVSKGDEPVRLSPGRSGFSRIRSRTSMSFSSSGCGRPSPPSAVPLNCLKPMQAHPIPTQQRLTKPE